MPSSSDTPQVDRAAVRRGGLVGVVLGVALLGLSLFFLVRGPQEPGEELGVFLPLAAALVCLGLGAMAVCFDMVDGAAEAVFALARIAGWLAHAAEERDRPFRFRPRASYVGPPPA